MSNYDYGEDIPYDIIPEITDSGEKRKLWDIATGLQKVDNLSPSEYLLELAEKNIRSEISYQEVDKEIRTYYSSADSKERQEHLEADIVSSKIVQLLDSGKTASFELSKRTLASIHYVLFSDVFSDELIVGKFRKVNISKKEPILNGASVKYGDFSTIPIALDITLNDEAMNFNPSKCGLTLNSVSENGIKHLARFTSEIWQIHPFREGNTRTTAVFIQLYLQSLGFEMNNKPFKDNSLYFRNALVRSCYADVSNGISPEPFFLNCFFDNLLCNKEHRLDNEELDLSRLLQIPGINN